MADMENLKLDKLKSLEVLTQETKDVFSYNSQNNNFEKNMEDIDPQETEVILQKKDFSFQNLKGL